MSTLLAWSCTGAYSAAQNPTDPHRAVDGVSCYLSVCCTVVAEKAACMTCTSSGVGGARAIQGGCTKPWPCTVLAVSDEALHIIWVADAATSSATKKQ